MTVGRVVQLPLSRQLRRDRELQVFLAFGLCLGFALVFGLFQLSSALGAFLAGMLGGRGARNQLGASPAWNRSALVFVAVFFVSVGLLVDVPFVRQNIFLVGGVTLGVFLGNTAVNALIFRLLAIPGATACTPARTSRRSASSAFVLAATGAKQSLISDFTHQLVIAVTR